MNAVDKNTILVACMQVNNEIGTQVDVNRLARRVKEKNPRTAVHVDGVQAWLRVPVKLDGIDSFTVSGHKIHAPKGVGALYLRRGYNIEPPYLGGGQEKGHGGGQEKGVRPGTENLPYAVGMAKAALIDVYKRQPVIPAPRAQLSKYAPKMLSMVIPVDKIKDVIGKGGKVIQDICANCNCKIAVEAVSYTHLDVYKRQGHSRSPTDLLLL